MAGKMSPDDIRQKFENSILMHKKRPVLFIKHSNGDARLFNLLSQEEETVEFKEEEFSPPIPRIGMVNSGGSVVYVERRPVRRFKLGYSTENLSVSDLSVAYADMTFNRIRDRVMSLRDKDMAKSMMKKYPTLKTCLDHVNQFDGAMAFDKQFAVSSAGELLYKHKLVGEHDGKKIFFNKEYNYLEQLVKA